MNTGAATVRARPRGAAPFLHRRDDGRHLEQEVRELLYLESDPTLVLDRAVTVDEYIAAADPDRREALRALREVIRDAAPQAREEIRHKMPYYVYHGDLVAFASQKNHFSVYVMGPRLADHLHELGKLNCGKGCIRFKQLEELPLDVLGEIVRETAAENEGAAS